MNCIQLKKQLHLFFPCEWVNGAHEKQNCVQTKESGFLSSPHPSIEQNSNLRASASGQSKTSEWGSCKTLPTCEIHKLEASFKSVWKKWFSLFKHFLYSLQNCLLLLLNRARRKVFEKLLFSEKGSYQIPLAEEELSTFVSDTVKNTSIIAS